MFCKLFYRFRYLIQQKLSPTEFRQTADLSDVLIYNASILSKEIEHLAGNNFPPPMIDVRNWFSFSIFGIPLPIFFKLGIRVDIVKECSGIADG